MQPFQSACTPPMKHDCPYCGAALGWRLVTSKPLPGERKILPQRAVPVCPACKGALATNIHWSEGVLGCAAALLAFLVQQLLSRAVQPGAGFFALMGAVVATMVALMVFFHFRYWRHWQRYKPYVSP